MIRQIGLIVLIWTLGYNPVFAQPDESIQNPSIKRASQAVAFLTKLGEQGSEPLGSGFFIDSSGILVTNYDLIHSARKIKVTTKQGGVYSVKSVIHCDVNWDACILKVDGESFPTVPLADSEKNSTSNQIYLIQASVEDAYNIMQGNLLGVGEFNNLRWLQYSLPSKPLNTGGPILNENGEVIGITTFVWLGGENEPKVNFGLSINEIKEEIYKEPKMTLNFFVESRSEADKHFIEGSEYLFLGDFNFAATYFQKALKINPRHASAYYSLGYCYNNMDRIQDAISLYEKAIVLNPKYPSAYRDLGVIYRDKLEQPDPNQAIKYFEKAAALDPSSFRILNELGSAYIAADRHIQAIVYFDESVKLNPYFAETYDKFSFVYSGMSQYDEAIKLLRRALAVDSRYAEAYEHLGTNYLAIDRRVKAKENLEKALSIYQSRQDRDGVERAQKIISENNLIEKSFYEKIKKYLPKGFMD